MFVNGSKISPHRRRDYKESAESSLRDLCVLGVSAVNVLSSQTFPQTLCLTLTLLVISLFSNSCTNSVASNKGFFGKVKPPSEKVFRYVTGSEPESLDPALSTGQPEARIYLALFEGLIEFNPKTMEPIPAIAESWELSENAAEYVFHLRRNARWSNGEPITAQDFVYTLQRNLQPALAARSAYMAYYIKYAQGYNENALFVRDPQTGKFLTEKEINPAHYEPQPANSLATETDFHQFISQPTRLVVPAAEKERAKLTEQNPKLKDALAGKEFVPVKAGDIGVEAVDDYTLRITLTQPAPFFLGMMGHQFFKVVPRQTIEKFGLQWTLPENIVCSGPFTLQSWKPYNELITTRNPYYWDAASVKLDKLVFYPLEDSSTILNLYKAGELDATFNHTIPTGWIDSLKPLKDYMDAPESAITYIMVNTTQAPMNNLRVRQAFSLSLDRQALAQYQKSVKSLNAFTPEGIFHNYPQPKGAEFNPEKAKQLLVQAGYKDAQGRYDPSKFPADQVEYTYNTLERNKEIAEFLQAQWKKNLGITIGLRNMEWKTFLSYRSKMQYKGFARAAWIGDYMDPFAFLSLLYSPTGDNGTGWWDQKYVDMLDHANQTVDQQKRYEMLAQAEKYLLDAQPVIPLFTNATNFVKKPYVKGFYPNPMTLHPWKFVYLENDPAKWDYGMPSMTE